MSNPFRAVRRTPLLPNAFGGMLIAGFVCISAGIAIPLLPPHLALVLPLIAAGVLCFFLVRAISLVRVQDAAAVARTSVATSNARDGVQADPALRFPRIFFYLGALSLSLLVFRPVFAVTLSDLLFLGAFAATCAYLVARRRSVGYPVSPVVQLGIGLFALGGLLSSFGAEEPTQSVAVIIRLTYLTLIWFWLASILLTRIEHLRTALLLWVVSASLTGGGAIVQRVAGDVIPGTHTEWGRMTGFTGHPNDLGGLTAVALVAAILFAVRPSSTIAKTVGAYLLLALIAAGLVLSGSVGALLAAAAGIVVWFSLTRTAPRTVAALLVIALLAAIGFASGSIEDASSPIGRISTVTDPDSKYATFWSRVETYREATERIEENPFVGVGLDEKSSAAGEYSVHNLVIGTWYTTGIIGLIGIVVVVGAIARTGWKTLAAARSEEEYLTTAALISSFAAFVIFTLSAPILYTRYGWISAALLVALRSAQLARSEAPVVPQTPRIPATRVA